MFVTVLFKAAKTWQQPKHPLTEEWINMWHIYTREYYSAIKKNEIMPFAATWMDLEFIKLSEVSQKEKDKYHVISLCMWNLKYDTNELVYKTETDSQIQKTNLQLPREKDLEEG